MGVTVVTSDATIQVNTSQKINIPTGWDAQVDAYGRGYNYPQTTGQTTVFRTGDDADIEAAVFVPVRVANSLKVQNSLINFLTLGNSNSFGKDACEFIGIDGAVLLTGLSLTTFDISVSIKSTSATVQQIISDSSENNQIRINSDGNLRIITNATLDIDESTTGVNVLDGILHTVRFVNNGTVIKMYVDSVEKFNGGSGSSVSRSWNQIGRRSASSEPFNGEIKNLTIKDDEDGTLLHTYTFATDANDSTGVLDGVISGGAIIQITARLTDINGLQIYGDNLVIDNYTGLMWFRSLSSALWNAAIDAGLASSVGGFTNWFIGSQSQYLSIYRNSGNGTDVGFDYPPFNIATSIIMHTSTTDQDPTANSIAIRSTQAIIFSNTKTTNRFFILCRKHF